MTEHVASRTLVKSPPELWAECSDAGSLARHLDQFGDIKITRLEPETAVAWEGERTRGTVRIEPSGWGTKVILTAVAVEHEQPESVEVFERAVEVVEPAVEVVEPAVEVVEPVVGPVAEVPDPPDPPDAPDTPPPRRRRFRLFRFRRAPAAPEQIAESEPEPTLAAEPTSEAELPTETKPPPVPALEETATATETTEAALTAALDSLGQAHHRPYSRA